MKRYESGMGMTIVMKADATEKQIEITKKLYPHAKIIIEGSIISFTKEPASQSIRVINLSQTKTTLNKVYNEYINYNDITNYYTYKNKYEINENLSSVA